MLCKSTRVKVSCFSDSHCILPDMQIFIKFIHDEIFGENSVDDFSENFLKFIRILFTEVRLRQLDLQPRRSRPQKDNAIWPRQG